MATDEFRAVGVEGPCPGPPRPIPQGEPFGGFPTVAQEMSQVALTYQGFLRSGPSRRRDDSSTARSCRSAGSRRPARDT